MCFKLITVKKNEKKFLIMQHVTSEKGKLQTGLNEVMCQEKHIMTSLKKE
jgi:hypothetical protein